FNAHVDIFARDGALGRGLVVVGGHTPAHDLHVAQRQIERVVDDIGAAGTYRRDDTAPVGVAAGHGTLPKRRGSDGAGRLAGIGVAGRATDVDDHEAGRAFAIARLLTGEVTRDIAQRRDEGLRLGGLLRARAQRL